MSSTYTGSMTIPATGGPAVVTVTGSGTSSGAANVSTSGQANNVQIGPAFSASNLDVVTGVNVSYQVAVPTWSSTVVPQLNGRPVTTTGTFTVNSVDPVNGIITVSGSGTIFAQLPGPLPILSTVGLGLLIIGLVSLGILLSRRRAKESGIKPA